MNVVFFVSGLDSGGIENYLLRFLTYKAHYFNHVIVYCKGGKTGQLEKKYRKISNLSIYTKKLSYFKPNDYFHLYRFLKKNNVKSVCDFTGNFAGLVLYTAKFAKVSNRIVFYRGSTNHFEETRIKLFYDKLVKKLTYKYATSLLSNSQAAFDFFYKKKLHDERFKVIYNGIDSTKFDVGSSNLRKDFNIPEDAFVIGHTGRFNYAKNHSIIIDIAKILINKYNDIYFIMCGNGVKTGLEDKVKELGLNNKIRLFENRDDIPIFLNTMDCYFFPSITEGQPNALIEAMIMGLPFIASDINPIIETVDGIENLYNPYDVKQFSNALESLYIKKPQRDQALREKTIKRFDYKKRFEEFYNIIINRR